LPTTGEIHYLASSTNVRHLGERKNQQKAWPHLSMKSGRNIPQLCRIFFFFFFTFDVTFRPTPTGRHAAAVDRDARNSAHTTAASRCVLGSRGFHKLYHSRERGREHLISSFPLCPSSRPRARPNSNLCKRAGLKQGLRQVCVVKWIAFIHCLSARRRG
jgi:hypothetical protein